MKNLTPFRPALALLAAGAVLALSGCIETSTTPTPASAQAAVSALEAEASDKTDKAIAVVQSGAQKMENFGNAVTKHVTYVSGKIESLGNLVIEATGEENEDASN